MTRILTMLCFAALAFASPAIAQNFPKLTGRVVDDAHLLSPAQVVDITSKSEALEAQSGRQFVVATVPSLNGRDIDQYGYLLGRAWGIGQKDKSDGVVLVVAPNERRVTIATGYGAGAYMTDAMSGIIIREDILPRFKQNDYGGGIVAGSDAIIKQMSLPPEEAQKNAAAAGHVQKERRQSSGGSVPVAFIVMIVAFIALSAMRRAGGRRYYRRRGGGVNPWVVLWGLNELNRASRGGSGWSGGSSWGGGGGSSWGGGAGFGGGGGFSGGGGSFGGGGASGSW